MKFFKRKANAEQESLHKEGRPRRRLFFWRRPKGGAPVEKEEQKIVEPGNNKSPVSPEGVSRQNVFSTADDLKLPEPSPLDGVVGATEVVSDVLVETGTQVVHEVASRGGELLDATEETLATVFDAPIEKKNEGKSEKPKKSFSEGVGDFFEGVVNVGQEILKVVGKGLSLFWNFAVWLGKILWEGTVMLWRGLQFMAKHAWPFIKKGALFAGALVGSVFSALGGLFEGGSSPKKVKEASLPEILLTLGVIGFGTYLLLQFFF